MIFYVLDGASLRWNGFRLSTNNFSPFLIFSTILVYFLLVYIAILPKVKLEVAIWSGMYDVHYFFMDFQISQ